MIIPFTQREEDLWRRFDEHCDRFKELSQSAFESSRHNERANRITQARLELAKVNALMEEISKVITEEMT